MPIGPGEKKDDGLFEEFETIEEQLDSDEELSAGTEEYDEDLEELDFEESDEGSEEWEEGGESEGGYESDNDFPGSDEPISLSDLSMDESYGEDGLE
jgi:hypothetical protein